MLYWSSNIRKKIAVNSHPMDKKTIKKALIDLDMTQAEIAAEIGITKQAVNGVVNGYWRSPRVEKRLMELVRLAQAVQAD